jgi:kynureninase
LEDVLAKIKEVGDELALVLFGGVNYYTGQVFDIKTITDAGHHVGAQVGWDLAHAAGNIELHLNEWKVDFAAWCSYKYMNSGPGNASGCFVHEKHHHDNDLPRFAGWWGHNKETRFQMGPDFDPIPTAESWSMSNAPVLNMVAHKVALDMFTEVGMEALRKKAMVLTAYLEFVLSEVERSTGQSLQIITPADPQQRGCQLSVIVEGRNKNLVHQLAESGVIVDWREPNVIRMAPVPMYNSFTDVQRFGEIFKRLLV